MSFSSPPPKSARSLTRSGSYLSLVDMQTGHSSSLKATSLSMARHDTAPYPRVPRQPKEARERRKSLSRSASSERLTISSKPRPSPSSKSPASMPMAALRTTSPLAPSRACSPPPRTSFPRSKQEPDLYRLAIQTRMRMSPEGRKILVMGPRLAFSIYSATRDLEQIVASQRDSDGDIDMRDGDSIPWVVLAQDDWEMLDLS